MAFRQHAPGYYLGWLRVAAEEAKHLALLRAHLHTLTDGRQCWDYGLFNGVAPNNGFVARSL